MPTTKYRAMEADLVRALGLERRPVAIAFRDRAPEGVEPFTGTTPSGCSFWALAAAGRTFYTTAADHHNCSIGSYTHNIPLPPGREDELSQTLSFMTEIGYIRMDEVPAIPRVAATPGVVAYAPLGDTPFEPDVVVLTGPPGRLMLLHEAAARGGVPAQSLFGRPTCMAIPASMAQALVSSMGCVGNRVYTGLPESDLYVSVSGQQLEQIVGELATVTKANLALADYHGQRRATLTVA